MFLIWIAECVRTFSTGICCEPKALMMVIINTYDVDRILYSRINLYACKAHNDLCQGLWLAHRCYKWEATWIEFLPQTFFSLATGTRQSATLVRYMTLRIYVSGTHVSEKIRKLILREDVEIKKKSSYKELIVSAFLYMFQYMGWKQTIWAV